MRYTGLLVLSLVGTGVLGQIPNLGFCPNYAPMINFDIDRFLGKWYEAERYFAVSEVGSRCITTEYSKAPNGKIYVSNEITNRLTGIKRVIDGQIDLTGATGEAKLSVKYNSFPPYDTSYVVLDTDYDTVAVIWSCNGIGPVHTQNAWVMTRNRNPHNAIMQRAYGVLDKNKISRTFFLKTDQKDCALGGDLAHLAPISESPETQEQEQEGQIQQEIKKKTGKTLNSLIK